MKLSRRQRRFVAEYVASLNGTQSAIRAGYGKRGARVTACRLLTNPNIAAAIDDAHAQRFQELDVTTKRILSELASVGFVDIERTTKIRGYEKVRALELLGRHMRLFVDRHEHTGKDGGPIATAISEPIDLFIQRLLPEERVAYRKMVERLVIEELGEEAAWARHFIRPEKGREDDSSMG